MLCVLAATTLKGRLILVLNAPPWHLLFGKDWELTGKMEEAVFRVGDLYCSSHPL